MPKSIPINAIICTILAILLALAYSQAESYLTTKEKEITPLNIASYFCPQDCNESLLINMQPDTCIFYDVQPTLSHQLNKTTLYVDKYAIIKNISYNKIINQKGRGIMHLKVCINQTHTYLGSTNPTDNGFHKNLNDILFIESTSIAKQLRSIITSEFGRVPVATIKKENSEFCISPYHNCAYKLIDEINKANQSIYVAAFSLTHEGVQQALFRAKKRGVEVKILLDKGQCTKGCNVKLFRQLRIPVTFYDGSGKMHLKQLIIDGKIVITGSMNFSENGNDYNNDIIAIIQDKALAKKYEERLDKIMS